MKAEPTLICIPDISGFTEFMSSTDIELSSVIIPSLLNKIIYSNEIGLRVSEIEGDAVLFYRNGKLPPFRDLIKQCRFFYTEFYSQLEKLHQKHKAEKNGDSIPETLGLKIILHYSEHINAVPIGKNIKLMGEDVIIAHRLLKNKVPLEEYILISDSVLAQYDDTDIERNFGWGTLREIEEEYKHLGEVSYSYINLTPLVE